MTLSSFANVIYNNHDGQVSWRGVSMADGYGFNSFITNDVASRLQDAEGHAEFEAHLRGLSNTGFAQDNLNAILAAEVPEERDWAVGEAIAEAYLNHEHAITWPWNMERDKRNPSASLPGADLIGFEIDGDNARFAFGEVKTSTDQNTPPGVMKGRSGMTNQIDNLAKNLSLICQVLKWLLHRCKNTEHEKAFNSAVGLFLDSGNNAISLFGVLIRDTQQNELDLQARGKTLSCALKAPTTCSLIAIYLPCAISDLPSRVVGGES